MSASAQPRRPKTQTLNAAAVRLFLVLTFTLPGYSGNTEGRTERGCVRVCVLCVVCVKGCVCCVVCVQVKCHHAG